MFLVKMCAFLARKASELEEGTQSERIAFGIMLISRFFADVVSRSDGFGVFGAVGSCHQKTQSYFLDLIWNALTQHLGDVYEAVAAYHPGLSFDQGKTKYLSPAPEPHRSDRRMESQANYLLPYMLNAQPPNVFSFFHLSFQSIKRDFVHPLSSWH